jgi:Outer membrane protein beta-barrel domain
MDKKRLVLLIVAMLLGLVGHSQILLSFLFGEKLNSEGLEFGMEVGFNWSDISDLEADKRLSEFNFGTYIEIRLKDQWHLNTSFLVISSLGADQLSSNDLNFLEIIPNEEQGTYSQRVNYLIVPALIKYKFRNRMYLEAGPQFGLMYKAWVDFFSDQDSKKIRIREFNKDKINKFDAGITVGTGYKLVPDTGMTVGIKYYFGLANVYKNVDGTNNSSLFLKLNIPIGAGKKDKETAMQ